MKVIIVEDNVETLGVLRDFVRAIDANYEVQLHASGAALMERKDKIQADLIILGYDLGPSVKGTELLHYLEWRQGISAKTHVIFLSNTIHLAKRQAPLRFTQTEFREKPMSLGHLQASIAWVKENQATFSSVFYLIDKQKWLPAFNSLQLCKANCPPHLQQQAWLLECMLLLKLGQFAKVIRRYQLIQDYCWARAIKLRALFSLGQYKAGRHLFNSMASQDAYYSATLALVNQLSIASGQLADLQMPASLKESELSLFECECKAIVLTYQRQTNDGLAYLNNKLKRAKRGSHQAYFYAVAILKTVLLGVFKEPTVEHAKAQLGAMQVALNIVTAQQHGRDKELNESLWPALLEHFEAGTITAASDTQLKVGEPTQDASPISLLVRMYLHWIAHSEVQICQVQACVNLIQQQGATSRATSNQLLLELMLGMMLPEPSQRVRLADALGTSLFKQAQFDIAAYAWHRAVRLAPQNPALAQKLSACMQRLEVKQFLPQETTAS
ncbi:response regulator [Aliidiomarina maris]|uniref:Response regulator receiver domain-containing protein n=1 Tax=Aliidiomarina maris TaxID=531312 RepID=A0A327X1V1_9GAMM|nr:response regulator [Aliidiomarina maris]RAJ98274.1 response regulator receiver domain-containing protein [Aliidiomarina maris]RUO24892.1 hypothetical protein CWE07_07595 [Aliidiomarina maris]